MPNHATGPSAGVDHTSQALAARSIETPPTDPVHAQNSRNSDRPRVLIVDDEANIRVPLGIILRHAGFDVATAATGAQALTAVAEGDVDLVLLDVGLPDTGGCDVCRAIREAPETSDLPVVMLSAHTSDIDVAKGLAAGADGYEPKPFSTARLLGLVERLCRAHKGRQAHA